MSGTVALVRRAWPVWDGAAPGGGLAPGALAPTAPRAGSKLELLHEVSHLNRADVYLKLASRSGPGPACPSGEFRAGHVVRGLYGYRVHGPYAPEDRHRFNAAKLLIDAKAITGPIRWSDALYGYVPGAEG